MTKEDKQGIVILIVLGFTIVLLFMLILNSAKANRTTYEYIKDGEVGKSKQCYQNNKQECMCLIDGNFIYVDNYYLLD